MTLTEQLNEKIQLIGKLAVQIVDLKEENQQLKELLKECREWIEFMEEKCRADENYKGTMYFKNLVKNIDEAIGEK